VHDAPSVPQGRAFGAGALVGAGVFVAGFGVLNVLALTLEYDTDLRGLGDYSSATWGDAVLLPLAAFLLVSVVVGSTMTRVDRFVGAAGAALGVLVGTTVQAAWLADPSPELNWTLIAPGVFNAAGWYHAAFLVAVAGLFGGCAAIILCMAIGRQLARRSAVLVVLGVLALVAFGVLLVLDNADLDRSASFATLISTGGGLAVAAAIAVLALVSLRRRVRAPSRR
jgi:hypothetical protein